jgi:hypothetical protein
VGCQDRRRLPLRARSPGVHARPDRRQLDEIRLPECAGMSLEREPSTNGRWSSRKRSTSFTHDDGCDQSERADVEGVGLLNGSLVRASQGLRRMNQT